MEKPVPAGIDRENNEPVRLFESDYLEFFTHVSPIAMLVIWGATVVYFFLNAIFITPGRWLYIPITFLFGIALWSLTEYMLHRFLFHFRPIDPSEKTRRFFFIIHGVHHYQPWVKTRLVMSPALIIPLTLLFYGICHWLIGVMFHRPYYISPLFTGFILGYTVYDLLHYSIHHFSLNGKYFRMIHKRHMAHHFKTPDLLFGITSPLWDQVFETVGRENESL